jgi:hypothetical protein
MASKLRGSLFMKAAARVLAFLFLPACLLPAPVAAQEPSRQPLQELFLTETVYPQDKHELQLTIGALVDRTRSDWAALVPFAIEYGISDRWQIEASWDGYTQFHSAPFKHLRTARLSVGTKYSWMQIAGSRVHAAVGIDVEFPRAGATGDDGEDDVEFEPFVSGAADLAKHFGVFASYGLSLDRGNASSLAALSEGIDDEGLLSGGVLVPYGAATLAVEYTTRSDQLPWRLGGSALVTPSLTVHIGDHYEAAGAVPIGARAGSRRPGLAFHLILEY